MSQHPLLHDCMQDTGLQEQQVRSAIGLIITKLEHVLPKSDIETLRSTIPEVDGWKKEAPKPKKGFLGKLAGSVGGDRAKLLMEISQGLSTLGIPVSQQKPLAHSLADSLERHYPQLKPVFEKLAG